MTGCEIQNTFFPLKEKHHARVFINNLDRAIEHGYERIEIKDFMRFEWDEVCFFIAYEDYMPGPNNRLHDKLGKDYKGYNPDYTCGWASSIRQNNLLFFKDNEVVMAIPVYDCRLRHHPNTSKSCYNSSAYIEIQEGKINPRLPGVDKPYKELTLTDSP